MDRVWKRELYQMWKKSKIDYSFTVNHKENGSSGTHYGNKKNIEIRLKPLYEDIKQVEEQMQRDLSHRKKDFSKYVTAHEIGHALDDTLESTRKTLDGIYNEIFWYFFQRNRYDKIHKRFTDCEKMHVGYEEKAWVLAEQFLLEEEKDEVFDTYKEQCLDSYRNTYKQYKKEWLLFYKVTNWVLDIKQNRTLCKKIAFDYVNYDKRCMYYQKEKRTIMISVYAVIEKLKESKDIGQTQQELFFLFVEKMMESHVYSFLKWKKRSKKIDDEYNQCERINDYRGMKRAIKKEDDLQIDKEKEMMKYVIEVLENHDLQEAYRLHKEKEIIETRKSNRESRKKVYRMFDRRHKREQEKKQKQIAN